jgi:hypothetical protein
MRECSAKTSHNLRKKKKKKTKQRVKMQPPGRKSRQRMQRAKRSRQEGPLKNHQPLTRAQMLVPLKKMGEKTETKMKKMNQEILLINQLED